MDKVLITGASGFIGQHLAQALQQHGWLVNGLGRTAQPESLKSVVWYQGDISDRSLLEKAVTGCRHVIHLACLSLQACHHHVMEAQMVNVTGTVNCLEVACQEGVKKFIFASSGQVYGGSTQLPNKEDDLPMPRSIYAASKSAAEAWCRAYNALHGMNVMALRLFNVYGRTLDNQTRQTVESLFWEQMLRGEKPCIYGNPKSGRDFIHVHDVVRAMTLALTVPNGEGIINIGSGKMTTLADLAALIGRILDREQNAEVRSDGSFPIQFQADVTRAKEILAFSPTISLEEGLNSFRCKQ